MKEKKYSSIARCNDVFFFSGRRWRVTPRPFSFYMQRIVFFLSFFFSFYRHIFVLWDPLFSTKKKKTPLLRPSWERRDGHKAVGCTRDSTAVFFLTFHFFFFFLSWSAFLVPFPPSILSRYQLPFRVRKKKWCWEHLPFRPRPHPTRTTVSLWCGRPNFSSLSFYL